MHCPSCHAECKPGAKFCAECGATLALRCASCGAECKPDAKFCAECGTPMQKHCTNCNADLTATGFRDTTRIAAGDPGLWTAIFAHNRDALLEALARFDSHARHLQVALETRNWPEVESLLRQAQKVRDALGN